MEAENLMSDRQINTAHEPVVQPPAILGRWQVWVVLLILLLIPFFVPIPRCLRYNPIIGHFGDHLHIPLLGAIYLMLYWKGRLRGRLWWGALTAAGIGGAIEFLQTLVGRGALLGDWFLDLLGIAIVLSFLLWRGQDSRLSLAVLIILLISIPLQSYELPRLIMATYESKERFPVLDDFDSPSSEILWHPRFDVEMYFLPRSGNNPDHFLSVNCPANKSWPGALMLHFPGDWQDYTQLVFSARHHTAGLDSLDFGVRLDDWEGRKDSAWISDHFIATADWQTYRVPLTGRLVQSRKRLFDNSDVISILFYLASPPQDMILELDDLYLQ